MKFEEIKTAAIAEWESLGQDEISVIRIGTATSDRASGALKVVEAFKNELPRFNLEATIIQTGLCGVLQLRTLSDH